MDTKGRLHGSGGIICLRHPHTFNRLRHGGKVPTTGVFPWLVLRDKDPRNRIFVPRDGLREDSWWFWGSSGEVFEDLGGVGVMDGGFFFFCDNQ